MTEKTKQPLNPDKFTWKPGDIRIIKKGGKPAATGKPVKEKKQ